MSATSSVSRRSASVAPSRATVLAAHRLTARHDHTALCRAVQDLLVARGIPLTAWDARREIALGALVWELAGAASGALEATITADSVVFSVPAHV
jgi:hypothetical protein